VWHFALAAISALGGTVQRLPAVPNAAVAQVIQTDTAGNIYVSGYLPPATPKSAADKSDAFVLKLSPDGSTVLYFTILGGSGADAATALAVGSDNSAYVTGTTTSNDFQVTPGALQTIYGGQNSFAAKLNPSGAIAYATYIGGSGVAVSSGIAVDAAGDAFILGSGAPTGAAPIAGGDPTHLGGFVVKIDPTGSKLLMGFSGLGGQFMAIDGAGDVYLTGLSAPNATVLPFTPAYTPGAFQTVQPLAVCSGDSFLNFACLYEYVAKVDPTGTKIIYLTGLNGTYGATPAGIALDASGNAIVAGTTNSPDFPVTPDALEGLYAPVIPPNVEEYGSGFSAAAPPATGFVAKLNATGSALVWSTFFGGSITDSITSMSLDAEGGVYIAGQAGSSDLPGLSGTPAGCRPSPTQKLSFTARLTPDGTSASPAQLLYGAPTYYAYGVAAPFGPEGPIYIASPALGTVVALENSGSIAAVDLFATSQLACLTDPTDSVQLLSVVPGQDLTIFGTNLADVSEYTGGAIVPTGLGVTFNGIAAPFLYISNSQLNVHVPVAIAGAATVQMEWTRAEGAQPEGETLTVAQRQPSVFLTAAALVGGSLACGPPGYGTVGPAAVALNADGSLNSPANPATVGSTMTIFLNGVAPGAVLTGTAQTFYGITPITLTSGTPPANNGALPVTFAAPPATYYALIQMQAGGIGTRETAVAVCVQPASE
jgi:uncharacterized protein (TIGR03437 family)